MVADRTCVCEEPIQRYDGRDPREHGEQREECHAAGCGKYPIRRDRREYAPEDIPPPTGRNLLWRVCFAPATSFIGTREIDRAINIASPSNLSAPVLFPVGVPSRRECAQSSLGKPPQNIIKDLRAGQLAPLYSYAGASSPPCEPAIASSALRQLELNDRRSLSRRSSASSTRCGQACDLLFSRSPTGGS